MPNPKWSLAFLNCYRRNRVAYWHGLVRLMLKLDRKKLKSSGCVGRNKKSWLYNSFFQQNNQATTLDSVGGLTHPDTRHFWKGLWNHLMLKSKPSLDFTEIILTMASFGIKKGSTPHRGGGKGGQSEFSHSCKPNWNSDEGSLLNEPVNLSQQWVRSSKIYTLNY